MPTIDLLVLVPILGFGAFLWVGLFIITRATVQTPLTIVSFIGMLAQAAYFFIRVLADTTEEGLQTGILISRFSWWANCIPVAIWFHMSSLVARRGKSKAILTPAVTFFYTAGLFLSFIGTFSDLFLDYSGGGLDKGKHVYVGVGSAYEYYMLYLALVTGAALVNFGLTFYRLQTGKEATSTAIKTQVGLLTIGAGLFMVGGVMLAIKFKFVINSFPDYVAYIFLLGGLGLFGYSIAQYGMLVGGKDTRRDFAYSFSSLLIMNLLYSVVLVLLGLNSPILGLAVVGLVTLNNALYDWGREILDRFFFSKDEQTARSEARNYATTLASQPVATHEIQAKESLPITVTENNHTNHTSELAIAGKENEKAFNDAVRKAITSLKNPPQLIQSPLLGLMLVGKRLKQQGLEDNRLNRAAILKSLFIELLERLRPAENITYGTTDAWRYYNVLYFPYIREVSKKQAYAEARRLAEERRKNGIREPGEIEKVLEWLSEVDEDTYYKWQRRASDTIASILREEEVRLQPSENPQPLSALERQ